MGFLGAALGGLGGGAIGSAVVQLGLDARALEAGLAKSKASVQSSTATMGQSASKSGAFAGMAATAYIAAGAAAVAFGASSVKAFQESEQVMAQTEAVLKSTGGAAGVTADEITELAASMQDLTTFSDEEVQSAENLLLTFTAIGQEIFPQTTQAVLDMSTALGQDLKSSAIQLGKALQDPILGLTALRRVGVNVSELIGPVRELVEAGDLLGAQQLILAEINTEFGGSAAAAADTYAGKIKQLGNEFNDFKEAIGETIVKALIPLIPLMEDIVGILQFLAPAVEFAAKAFFLMISPLRTVIDLLNLGASPLTHFAQGLEDLQASAESMTTEQVRAEVVELTKDLGLTADEITGLVNLIETNAAFDHLEEQVVGVAGSLFNELIPALEQAGMTTEEYTTIAKAAAAAALEQKAAQDQLAGGLLGLIASSDQLEAAQRDLNEMQEKGIDSGKRYREAVLNVLEANLSHTEGLKAYAQSLADSEKPQAFAIAKLDALAKGSDITREEIVALVDEIYKIGPAVNSVPAYRKVTIEVAVNTVASGVIGLSQLVADEIADALRRDVPG